MDFFTPNGHLEAYQNFGTWRALSLTLLKQLLKFVYLKNKIGIQMIKILAACGAGVNSSHQIKVLWEEVSNRGYDVHCDAVMVKMSMKTWSRLWHLYTNCCNWFRFWTWYSSDWSWTNLVPYSSNERSSIWQYRSSYQRTWIKLIYSFRVFKWLTYNYKT